MKKQNQHIIDVIKASRKGSREAELDIVNGFVSRHKIHKSKKTYNRKEKHKTKNY